MSKRVVAFLQIIQIKSQNKGIILLAKFLYIFIICISVVTVSQKILDRHFLVKLKLSLLLSLDLVDQSHLAILDDSLEGRVIGINQFGPLPC